MGPCVSHAASGRGARCGWACDREQAKEGIEYGLRSAPLVSSRTRRGTALALPGDRVASRAVFLPERANGENEPNESSIERNIISDKRYRIVSYTIRITMESAFSPFAVSQSQTETLSQL